MKVKEGEEAASYGTIQDRRKIDGVGACYGLLMLDEMKLKHDININMIAGEIIGFASSRENFMSLRDDVRACLKDLNSMQQDTVTDDSDGGSEDERDTIDASTVSYVNQFRFRSTKNKTTNLEFFFNDGSFTGNELLYQLFHVLSMCNVVNVNVLGACLDAGGNNSILLSLLRHEKKLGNDSWLHDEGLVTFRDPNACHIKKERRITNFHCSTHNQKTHRNAFLLSSDDPKTSRFFLSADGVRFTWQDSVLEMFLRDRVTWKPSTTLNKSSTYPNAWNKMCVSYSLSPFIEHALNDQFTHLGIQLGCLDEVLWKGTLEEDKDLGLMYCRRLKILKDTLSNKSSIDF